VRSLTRAMTSMPSLACRCLLADFHGPHLNTLTTSSSIHSPRADHIAKDHNRIITCIAMITNLPATAEQKLDIIPTSPLLRASPTPATCQTRTNHASNPQPA
jgi:hypothetical protein